MNNPFNIAFGRKPYNYISRLSLTNKVINTFDSDYPSSQVYMISGVRGAGKTVLMTSITKELSTRDEWICVELNPELDLLEELAAKLYSIPALKSIFIKAKIDLSFWGIGISVENGVVLTNIESAIEAMLSELKKHGKKVLVAIDEVVPNKNVKVFSGSFQIFVRHEYDVFLLMTGLYENIYNLQNVDTLTFLYRAPKLVLEPLSINAVALSYKEVFGISDEEAALMAKETKGYAFAYQVLGYLKWEHKTRTVRDLYPEYDSYLAEYVYDKIWHELSDTDIKFLVVIAMKEEMRTRDIISELKINSNNMSAYRDRLLKKGLIFSPRYGYLSCALPRMDEYIRLRLMI
ncbi:MAG: ATP-binding protein [Lachnospiraceae bacterium]|nr:ATP-binding protein [Lachnospiraceae bacterium]